MLANSWAGYADAFNLQDRAWKTIADYNADTDYVSKVFEVMAILAKRVEPEFRPAYEEIFDQSE